jgi:hypothetical protein
MGEKPYDTVEERAGVEPLAALHAERDRLITQAARLRALYSDNRMWEAQRKVQLAVAELKVRDAAVESKTRMTEGKIESLAHTHPEYTAWLARSIEEKATWLILDNKINSLNDRIRNRENEMHWTRAEMGLAR